MNIKVLDVPGSIERDPHRYRDWRNVFGKDSFAIVHPRDLELEIKTGELATVNYLNDDLSLRTVQGEGITSDLFLAREFVDKFGSLPNLKRIDRIMEYVEQLRDNGDIGSVVNSRKGTLNQKDKLSDISLGKELNVRMPGTFHFENYDTFRNFVISGDSSYVVKHRFGADGFDIRKATRENISEFKDINFESYVVQEELDIDYETRIVMLDGEFLGARKIIDRTRPWEQKGNGRKHELISHEPSEYEVSFTRQIMKYYDIRLGCVDWVGVGQGDSNMHYLETNGVATGYGCEGAPYDLNKTVALKLQDCVGK